MNQDDSLQAKTPCSNQPHRPQCPIVHPHPRRLYQFSLSGHFLKTLIFVSFMKSINQGTLSSLDCEVFALQATPPIDPVVDILKF